MCLRLDSVATQAVFDSKVVQEHDKPIQFVKRCLQLLHGSKYDIYCQDTPRESALQWSFHPDARAGGDDVRAGDIGFWTSDEHGKDGYCAIRIPGGLWAGYIASVIDCEGANKGFLPIDHLGNPSLIVRLHPP